MSRGGLVYAALAFGLCAGLVLAERARRRRVLAELEAMWRA